MVTRVMALVSLGLVVCACGASGGLSDTAPLPDARSTDQVEELMVADVPAGDQVSPGCQLEPQGVLLAPDSGTRKFALSLFHYNLQYVAGGLVGFMDKPETDLTDLEVQDRIIVESFFPMLDILEQHPTWGMDAEMQGMMVEAIAQRHAGVLPRIQALVSRGQLHIDSFHYSDQLWVAYPWPSMAQSFAFNERAFASACLPLGKAVFTQEGQFGHGMVHHIEDSDRIALYPTNLFKYFSGSADAGALAYEWDQTPVVIAGKSVTEEVAGEEVSVTWHFMNDGELAFTGNANPYFGTFFAYDKKSTQKYVEELEELEADGWAIVTVADYVAHLDALGYQKPPMPLALDGAWQPKDTQNVLRWMGQVGELGGPEEDDNGVLTGNVKSRFLLQAAAAAAPHLGMAELATADALQEGWYHQLLAEVSDSTGWNPWPGEVKYSKEHAAQAGAAAWALVAAALGEEGLTVDTATGQVADEASLHFAAGGPGEVTLVVPEKVPGEELWPVLVEAPGRTATVAWFETGLTNTSLVEVTFGPGVTEDHRFIRVVFERSGDTLSYVPALMEEEGNVTDFDITQLALDETQFLALGLANGLLGLGQDRWVIKVATTLHLAAIIPKTAPQVRFENHTQAVSSGDTWSFLVLDDVEAQTAVALANRVNVQPVVKLVAP
jgi:hypothetical protein